MKTWIGAVVAASMFPLLAQAEPNPSQSWSLEFESGRYVVLNDFFGEAVLDRETGLVWQQTVAPASANWTLALAFCRDQDTGGRYGWRLPSQEELASLGVAETDAAGLPALVLPGVADPKGSLRKLIPGESVFATSNVSVFWTATTYEFDQTAAYVGSTGLSPRSTLAKTAQAGVWCVRGGAGPINPGGTPPSH